MNDPDITGVLHRAQTGDDDAREQLLASLYDELHAIARRQFASERADHTLQSTALVNEAWIRLVDQTRVEWQGRAHFLAVAAQAMRRILVDHARGAKSLKRGGDAPHLSLTVADRAPGGAPRASTSSPWSGRWRTSLATTRTTLGWSRCASTAE